MGSVISADEARIAGGTGLNRRKLTCFPFTFRMFADRSQFNGRAISLTEKAKEFGYVLGDLFSDAVGKLKGQGATRANPKPKYANPADPQRDLVGSWSAAALVPGCVCGGEEAGVDGSLRPNERERHMHLGGKLLAVVTGSSSREQKGEVNIIVDGALLRESEPRFLR